MDGDSAPRTHGPYWVRDKNGGQSAGWQIAEWDGEDWFLPGATISYSEEQWEEIDPRPIVRSSDPTLERVARALYERNPRYDQETDADGRPTSAPYRIEWADLIEWDAGIYEDMLEDARAAIAALPTPCS